MKLLLFIQNNTAFAKKIRYMEYSSVKDSSFIYCLT